MPNVTWTLERSFLRGKNQEFELNLEMDLKKKHLRKDKKLWNYI
jgi:hypothetical protein